MEKMMIAYRITERHGVDYWNRIGVAFGNRDGSINVKLDSFPVNGELQLRVKTEPSEPPPEPKKKATKKAAKKATRKKATKKASKKA